jgi:hypothetical protein
VLYQSKYKPDNPIQASKCRLGIHRPGIQGMEFFAWCGALLFKIGSFDNYDNKTCVHLCRGEQLVGINNNSIRLNNPAFIIARP